MENQRATKLNRLFENVIYGRQSISRQNGGLFLEAVSAQTDADPSISRQTPRGRRAALLRMAASAAGLPSTLR